MYFRLLIFSIITVKTLFTAALADIAPDSDKLKILNATPNKCVALREGRACYAVVTLNWQRPSDGDYCLRNRDNKHIIQCWINKNSGNFEYEFDSKTSQHFELINTTTGQSFGQTEVKVHWVYQNKQKKRRWRLF